MTHTQPIPLPWQADDIDRWMLLVVAGNMLVALWLGHDSGQMAVAATVAAVTALMAATAVWRACGTLFSRMALSVSLSVLVAVQIHLAGGALQAHFNVYVSLSLLLAWRDWRPVATMAGLFVVHHVVFNQMLAAGVPVHVLAAPNLSLIALDVALIALHSGLLCRIALSQEREARAARELDFLVNAMGRDGKIRLNLAVIKPETPVGERLHHVQQRMAAAVSAMHAASQSIEVAAQQVATGSGELMSRTVVAADGLKDSAMCLDQIGVIVQHNNEASTEARAMSTTAAGMADQGGRMVTDVVGTMQDIQVASRRITDIIGVIDGIAFQTNILALNAAVEAARAGEQGRGFAVVASEVRSLAQRSAAAAKEIKTLIHSSSATIDTGTRMVSGAGETMNQLVSSVRRVGELFEAVTADTAEQMHGLRTVSQSIRDLSDATQRNVGVAEQASAAAMDLRRQSACLADALNAFNLGAVAGSGTSSPAPVDTPRAPASAPASALQVGASAAARAAPAAPAAPAREQASTGEVEYF